MCVSIGSKNNNNNIKLNTHSRLKKKEKKIMAKIWPPLNKLDEFF